jgi:hypothetical protein
MWVISEHSSLPRGVKEDGAVNAKPNCFKKKRSELAPGGLLPEVCELLMLMMSSQLLDRELLQREDVDGKQWTFMAPQLAKHRWWRRRHQQMSESSSNLCADMGQSELGRNTTGC